MSFWQKKIIILQWKIILRHENRDDTIKLNFSFQLTFLQRKNEWMLVFSTALEDYMMMLIRNWKKKKWNNLNMGAVLGFDSKTKKKVMFVMTQPTIHLDTLLEKPMRQSFKTFFLFFSLKLFFLTNLNGSNFIVVVHLRTWFEMSATDFLDNFVPP